MFKLILPFYALLISSNGIAQSIYKTNNYKNFRKSPELQQVITPASFNPELLNAAIFFATNEIRAKKKLTVLSYNKKLEKAATIHSNDMAKLNFFNHTNTQVKSHKTPTDRAKLAGIANPKIAENIIEGFLMVYTSGENVIPKGPGKFVDPNSKKPLPYHTYLSLTDVLIDNWMHSKGHRSNILSKDGVELGCGCALYYMRNFNDMPAVKATQNFQWFEKVK